MKAVIVVFAALTFVSTAVYAQQGVGQNQNYNSSSISNNQQKQRTLPPDSISTNGGNGAGTGGKHCTTTCVANEWNKPCLKYETYCY
jgi:hypothetical protein